MSDRYCKIFFEGNKSDFENLMKEKDWKFDLHEIDDKTLLCKINDENYEEIEFFKGITVDELERTRILDVQEIDKIDYNKEVNAIKDKEEKENNQESDERNADNIEDDKEKVENESEKVKNEIHNENEKNEQEDEKERYEIEDEKERNEDNFDTNENKNLEETSKKEEINNEIKNDVKSEEEKPSSPKKQNNLEEKKEKSNKKEISNKEIEPEEEKYEKINLKDVLLPSKNKLDENDIMNTLISKDYLIKFFILASGVITFLCFFEK